MSEGTWAWLVVQFEATAREEKWQDQREAHCSKDGAAFGRRSVGVSVASVLSDCTHNWPLPQRAGASPKGCTQEEPGQPRASTRIRRRQAASVLASRGKGANQLISTSKFYVILSAEAIGICLRFRVPARKSPENRGSALRRGTVFGQIVQGPVNYQG